MARHVVYSGVRMTLYDILRTNYKSKEDMMLVDRAMLGMVSGGLGQLVASPADLVKVRMQMEGRRRLQVCRDSLVNTSLDKSVCGGCLLQRGGEGLAHDL